MMMSKKLGACRSLHQPDEGVKRGASSCAHLISAWANDSTALFAAWYCGSRQFGSRSDLRQNDASIAVYRLLTNESQ